MNKKTTIYKSSECKTEELSSCYLKTHRTPHRYLAFRDIPRLIRKFVQGNRALDYGAGTGSSTSFLYDLGLDVIGIDVSPNMLKIAKSNFPYIQFCNIKDLKPGTNFNLAFSSFVLLELSSKEEIIRYLHSCSSSLQKNGIFIGITGSEHLYSGFREWATFNTNFQENLNLQSGDIAKVELKYPNIEFYDYYWKEDDFLDCFKNTDLEILEISYPLGSLKDPYVWKDELSYSPFTIFTAKKNPPL